MNIQDFMLSEKGKRFSKAEWSRKIGVTRGYFSQLVQGDKEPSLRLAHKIESVTGGDVKMQDWVDDGRDKDPGFRGQASQEVETPPT